LLSLTSGGRKNKRTEIDDRKLHLSYAKVERTKELTGRITSKISKLLEEYSQIIWGLYPSSTPGLLSLTSGDRKNKKILN